MTNEKNRRIEITDLGLKSQIFNPISALQLPTQTFGTPDNPINFLIREQGVPSVAELSLDEPRCLVILEDISDGGWEGALIKERATASKAIGFAIHQGKTEEKPLLTVAEFERKSIDNWSVNSASETNFEFVGFELGNDVGYLAGIAQATLSELPADLQLGRPFVVEVNQYSAQLQIHF